MTCSAARSKEVFVEGPVLRRILKRGGRGAFLDAPFFNTDDMADDYGDPVLKNMIYKDYVSYMRHTLLLCGLSEEEADMYASHSVRRGAATKGCAEGVPAHLIQAQAGTADPGWIADYDEISPGRRCEASRALGI